MQHEDLCPSNVLLAALDYADTHGALIVAAAGNDQATRLTWPAADARVISVGAIDAVGQQVTFSNSGPQLQISAPGYGVQTAWINQQRVYMDGTSAAAPLVAGALATVLSFNPTLTAAQAWEILSATTNDAGAPGPDADYGRGTVNLGWALGRNDPTRVDAALSSHFYDSTRAQMEIVIQNRGGQALSGLTLDVDIDGLTANYRVPTLAAGASTVIAVPVDKTTLAARGALTYKTTLSAPIGINDQDPTNNIKTSRLAAPKR
jgi:subtilisin family serine protease